MALHLLQSGARPRLVTHSNYYLFCAHTQRTYTCTHTDRQIACITKRAIIHRSSIEHGWVLPKRLNINAIKLNFLRKWHKFSRKAYSDIGEIRLTPHSIDGFSPKCHNSSVKYRSA